MFAGVGLAALVGCGSNAKTDARTGVTPTGSAQPSSAATGECSTIPQETAGPYPADGSNGPNVLTDSGIVRSDIRSSFGSSTTTAPGVPLTVKLTVQDGGTSCAPLAGAAVYLWHCNRDGAYSLYSQGVQNENYLRGVQASGADGVVTFTTIFPAAYSGRWPHIHFEVFPSLGDASAAANRLTTSQLALPKPACDTVFATSGYEQSVRNLAQSSLDSDMVFRDGYTLQLANVTGSVGGGFVATLPVTV